MRDIANLSLLIAFLAGQLVFAAPAIAQEKIEGKVLQTKLTACEFKPGSCAGSMVIEADRQGKPEQVTVQVRLGVPIKHGGEYLYLPALRGSVVSVAHVNEKGEFVAKSIDVVKKAAR